MIRATGRPRNESSPSSVAVRASPASTPPVSRRLVPEFPQSSVDGRFAEAVDPGGDDAVADRRPSSLVRSTVGAEGAR